MGAGNSQCNCLPQPSLRVWLSLPAFATMMSTPPSCCTVLVMSCCTCFKSQGTHDSSGSNGSSSSQQQGARGPGGRGQGCSRSGYYPSRQHD